MAVTVDKNSASRRDYPQAENAFVDATGHLIVQQWISDGPDSAWQNCALHAPGAWHRVEVTQNDDKKNDDKKKD